MYTISILQQEEQQNFFFTSIDTNEALEAKKKYQDKYGQTNASIADVIVAIGGDGFLLKTLHDQKDIKKPIYGINYGSIGFLMNSKSDNPKPLP